MNEDSSESDEGFSRRKVVELVAHYSGYVLVAGPIAALGTLGADASVAAEPSIGLIKDLFSRLDSTLSQGLAASQLAFIETDHFDPATSSRPRDLWECMKTWPLPLRTEAIELLLRLLKAERD